MGGDAGVAEAPVAAAADVAFGVSLDRTENGAVLSCTYRNGGAPTTKRVCVQAKDLASDAARRRIQRSVVRWAREAFPAPKRSDAGKTE